ncbi:MAG: pirin family protein [Fidelibacterota bacterium]
MIRPVEKIIGGMPTSDGAGVSLKRILGTPELDHLDPFLLLDEFKSEHRDDYMAGFPSHPHRGFETITYLLHGKFRHKDSKGNEGLLTPGSVQWMTAGRGIIHSEMPEMEDGLLWGFQLWLNLPAEQKMVEPRYQDIPAEMIPVVEQKGTRVKIISGEYRGTAGPALIRFPITYLDVQLSASVDFTHPVPQEMNCFCYVYGGGARFGPAEDTREGQAGEMVVFGDGETVSVTSDTGGARFLFLAAQRLNEPVARAGPFVMTTEADLRQAFLDYRNGTFDR